MEMTNGDSRALARQVVDELLDTLYGWGIQRDQISERCHASLVGATHRSLRRYFQHAPAAGTEERDGATD